MNGVSKMSEELLEQAEAEAQQAAEEALEVNGTTTDEESDEAGETKGVEDVVVTIGEESPTLSEEESKAPEWVRELRKSHRETLRRNKELEEKLTAVAGAQQKPVEQLGPKPTLDDFDYDSDRYEKALDAWYDRKRDIDEQVAKVSAEKENQQKAWQSKLDGYSKAKTDLRVRDFEDAELIAQDSLTITQQGVILQGAENPALVIYALGKNPTRAKELGSINDPVKFAFAVAKLETQLKVTNRKSVPAPEKTVRGTGSISGAVDSQLERLRADAEKTGDYSKVVAYKKQKRQA
jgi:hypothetical protein